MKIMFAVIVLSVPCRSNGHIPEKDTVIHDSVNVAAKSKVVKRIGARFHSIGFFNFSGRICSNTPAADLNFVYEKKGYGISVFGAKDLSDNHSENNFAFGFLYKRISLSRRLSITPSVAAIMDGQNGAIGDGLFFIAAYKVSPKLTIDETSLFANLLNPDENKEWVNRLRFIYSQTNHIQFIMSSWHNNALFDDNAHLSGAFQAGYNRIAIAEDLYLHTSVSFFVMAANTEEVPYREKNGLLLTVGMSFE